VEGADFRGGAWTGSMAGLLNDGEGRAPSLTRDVKAAVLQSCGASQTERNLRTRAHRAVHRNVIHN